MNVTNLLINTTYDVLLAIFVVDRYLKWQERKKWNQAREMYLAYASRCSKDIIGAWKIWLVELSKQPTAEISNDNSLQSIMIELGYYPAVKGMKMLVETYLGNPIGSKLDKITLTRDEKRDKEIVKCLVPYLASVLAGHTKTGWKSLADNLKSPIEKLNILVDRYASLVDPKFASCVLRLNIELENLQSGKYSETLPAEKKETRYLAQAMVIGYAIEYSLSLSSYIAKYQR